MKETVKLTQECMTDMQTFLTTTINSRELIQQLNNLQEDIKRRKVGHRNVSSKISLKILFFLFSPGD